VKLYTRTGDGGETALFDGTRVSKDDARIDACGEVDELNAWLGFARSSLEGEWGEDLATIQRALFAFGALLADPAGKIASRVTKAAITEADVAWVEQRIDHLELEVPPLRRFILAGGAPAGAVLHVARAVCRRTERRLVGLRPPVQPILLQYINRLSDLLFVLARAVNCRAGAAESEW
jgi:cob(I)alamin adenosyltransferase